MRIASKLSISSQNRLNSSLIKKITVKEAAEEQKQPSADEDKEEVLKLSDKSSDSLKEVDSLEE